MTSQLITDRNSQQIFTTAMMGRFQIASIVTTLFFSQISLAYRLEPSPETNSIFASVPSSSHSSSNLSQKHGVKVFYQSGVSSSFFCYFFKFSVNKLPKKTQKSK